MINTSLSLIDDLACLTGGCKSGYTPVCYQEAFTLIFVMNGRGVVQSGRRMVDLDEKTIYIIDPRQPAGLMVTSQVSGIVLCFSSAFSTQLPTGCCIRASDEDAAFLKAIAARMLTEFRNAYDLRSEMLDKLLQLFIARVCQQPGIHHVDAVAGKRAALARQFQHLVETNFKTKKMVSEYAGMLQVSTNYLNAVVRLVSGYPASFHIHQRIVREAKRQAVEERSSMKEIAYRLGFPDQSHFSKYFRKNCGQRFMDFRKEISYL